MEPLEYFIKPQSPAQKQYCALAAFFKDNIPAKDICRQYSYTVSSFYSLIKNFRKSIAMTPLKDPFFLSRSRGRKMQSSKEQLVKMVIALRNNEMSNFEISKVLKVLNWPVSQPEIWRILSAKGFGRLKRRTKANQEKKLEAYQTIIAAQQ